MTSCHIGFAWAIRSGDGGAEPAEARGVARALGRLALPVVERAVDRRPRAAALPPRRAFVPSERDRVVAGEEI